MTELEVETGSDRLAEVPVPARTVSGAVEWLGAHRQSLSALLRQHGALVFPRLPVVTAEDFQAVRASLVDAPALYREKATPRTDLGGGVFSSTDFPAGEVIRQHNENSYALSFPGVLVFGCLTAPDVGGATPVTDVRQVLRTLPTELVRRFRDAGWLLQRVYREHIGLSWQTAFDTEESAEVNRYCRENQVSHEWLLDGSLRTQQRRSAIITHPTTTEEVWFNHVVFWNEWSLEPGLRDVMLDSFGVDDFPFNTYVGDGSPVSRDEIEAIDEAYRAATVRRPWERGDVVVVDNILAAHGRDPYQGDRRIVVGMGDPVDLADCAPTVPVTA